MASSPMTTLSIGGVSPGNGNGVREHHSYETILRLKSWNQDLELISTDHLQSGNAPVEMAVSNGFRSGSHNSSNGLKRKRSELPGAHSTPLYDGGESRMGLGLGLGQVDDSSSMDEDSGVVLGLGQSDTRNYSGNMSGSANFCGSLGGDETVHSGNAMSEMLLARSQAMNRTEPGVLLRLNSMGDLQSGAPGMGGSGWPGDGQQYNGNAERRVGSHLGLAPSRTGYVDMTDSTNGRKFGSDGGLLLGLGQGAKAQSGNGAPFPVVDEGSSTARLTSGGYMPSLLMGSQIYPTVASDRQRSDFRGKERMDEGLVEHDLLFNLRASASGGTTSTSGASGSDRAPKVCKFRGCGKGPRGASGLCIAHGGGRRCQKHGCNKGAEGRTVYCKAHGGGRRCQNLGCTKSAEGKTDFCIGHGGGRRCSHQGCDKAARGRSGLCIRHGGGKRCQIEGCTKSAEGYSGLCISHGGGRRCQFAGCTKGAQGSTMFCKAHGGGKRCIIQDCNKGAEGSTPLCKGHGGGKRCAFDGGGICTKSVHGGTLFCVAHGGGKRCAVEGCGKSARGRTDFCVRHGGGKRCKVEGCGKSAQGSTDFCKAHGGGKRCQWGQEGSNFNDPMRDKNGEQVSQAPCDKFARGKTGLCAAHSALVSDRQVHGGSAVGSAVTPGLAPGLFRGLVTGAGQNRPSALATTSTGADTAATGGSRPVASVSVEMSRATESPVVSGSDAPSNTARPPLAIWAQRGSGLSKSSMSVTSQGFTASMDTTNVSIATDSPGGTVHGPYRGGLLSASPGGSQHGDRNGFTLPKAPGVGNLADSTAGLDLNPSRVSEPSPTPSSLPFHQPFIPPQVLVPLSMQKDMHGSNNKSKNGRPPRPQLSDADEGVYNAGMLSLPEGRVHGGGLMPSISESRVHGGRMMSVLPEGRVHGGGVMALLNKDPTSGSGSRNQFSFGMATPTHNLRYPGHGHHHSLPGTCAVGNGLLRPDLSLERSNSLGIDVGQFLATGVDLN
ncbi:hypothetical protein KC19_3G097900 [Ceratodon purpureus]|uniref:WRKY19-like zinc finger domain-containing protein n=1 Tax=Ceratodon purpureus TaxID=3225 RepID=A0A8T0IJB7_CERPU|nr:hypothetical protein KC19_3G097900 [Ceratodon purpureus]